MGFPSPLSLVGIEFNYFFLLGIYFNFQLDLKKIVPKAIGRFMLFMFVLNNICTLCFINRETCWIVFLILCLLQQIKLLSFFFIKLERRDRFIPSIKYQNDKHGHNIPKGEGCVYFEEDKFSGTFWLLQIIKG